MLTAGESDDSRQREAGRVIEGAKLGLGALATAGADEHVDVVRRGATPFERLLDARRVDAFDDQQLVRSSHDGSSRGS
jgi:hypothetical protein